MTNADQLEINRLRMQQRALADFGSFAFRETDLHAILTEATRLCASLMDVSICKIVRYRADQRDLVIEAGVGLSADTLEQIAFSLDTDSGAPGVEAFVTGQAIYGDLTQRSVLAPFYRDNGIVSTINVLISSRSNGPYGVLQIDSLEQRTYAQPDVDFLTGFANVLAEAINTNRRLVELTQLIDQKHMLLQELSHRVRNNLQLIHSMLDLATSDPSGSKVNLDVIARRVFILAQIYDHLLGNGMQPSIDLAGYLRALCAGISKTMTHKQVTLNCGHMTHVATNLDVVTALGLAVTELIANGQQHAFGEDKPGTITLTLDVSEGATILRVSDNGRGMVINTEVTKRHGLGLVRRLVQGIHGQIAFVSDASGTTATITF